MKGVIISVILSLFFLGLVIAQSEDYCRTYKNNTEISISIHCTDIDGNNCDSSVNCSLTARYPDGIHITANNTMTYTRGGWYNKTLGVLDVVGDYEQNDWTCSDGTYNDSGGFCFRVVPELKRTWIEDIRDWTKNFFSFNLGSDKTVNETLSDIYSHTEQINRTTIDINGTVYYIKDFLLDNMTLELNNIKARLDENSLNINLSISKIDNMQDDTDKIYDYLVDKWGGQEAKDFIQQLSYVREDLEYIKLSIGSSPAENIKESVKRARLDIARAINTIEDNEVGDLWQDNKLLVIFAISIITLIIITIIIIVKSNKGSKNKEVGTLVYGEDYA